MKKKSRLILIESIANAFELLGVMLVLVMALVFQFGFHELPCPLCLLQRLGFLGIAFGFLLNLRFGFRPSHYAIVILSGLFTSFVALRQISLHVLPGTGAYGSAVFGLHMYTWSFIISMMIVLITTILFGFDRQYLSESKASHSWRQTVRALFVLMIFVTVANTISVLLECGMHACPDNPVSYALSI